MYQSLGNGKGIERAVECVAVTLKYFADIAAILSPAIESQRINRVGRILPAVSIEIQTTTITSGITGKPSARGGIVVAECTVEPTRFAVGVVAVLCAKTPGITRRVRCGPLATIGFVGVTALDRSRFAESFGDITALIEDVEGFAVWCGLTTDEGCTTDQANAAERVERDNLPACVDFAEALSNRLISGDVIPPGTHAVGVAALLVGTPLALSGVRVFPDLLSGRPFR